MRYLPLVLIVAGLFLLLFGWQQSQSETAETEETVVGEVLTVVTEFAPDNTIQLTETDEIAVLTSTGEPTLESTAVPPTPIPVTPTDIDMSIFAVPTETPQPEVNTTPTEVAVTVFPTRQPGNNASPQSDADTATETLAPTVDVTVASTEPPTIQPTVTISMNSSETEEQIIRGPVPASSIIPAPPMSERFGVTVPENRLLEAEAGGLVYGSFINWRISIDMDGNYWRMVRTTEEGYSPSRQEVIVEVIENPGEYWLIGNEMDVFWQDNITAERYAEMYHELYWLIKEQDPSARVGIGGVSQPTALRRAYLDRILDHYQATYNVPMPIDVWNVHAFILPEVADSWGVGVPPDMDTIGEQYTVEQHTDIDIFKQNIIDFRAWMAARGYQNRPLVISEYGVLMPPDYGFPPEVVAEFLVQTFDFFTTAANETGYPADDGRLVQWWFWFSLYDDFGFPSGDLYDPDTNQLTAVGEAFSNYPRTEP